MPVSAVRKRLPNEWPTRPPPLGKRYWKSRVSRASSSARAAMQLRMSPGGRTPSSRRRRPDEPPSSVTVTTPVICRRPEPTWCFRPRSRTERPVPPPIATRDRKSTRLNSSHQIISYAVFCLKKKKNKHQTYTLQKKKRNAENNIEQN